jgi:hypothetical protein
VLGRRIRMLARRPYPVQSVRGMDPDPSPFL